MSNRRGYGIVGFIFLFGFLLIMWPLILAPMFTQAGIEAVAHGATGLEAFLWTNLNLWFGLTLLIVMLIYTAFGGGQ